MEKQTTRIEALSDGVFGVAITLLAIEIGIKEYAGADNTNLWQRILERWPEYFSYFNSFATVLLVWMGHHRIFGRLHKADHGALLLNGLVLLVVALFPFPTKTVGTFIGTAAENTAVAFYAGFTGSITLSLLLFNLYIRKRPELLIDPEKSRVWFAKMIRGQVIGIAAYAAIAVLALFFSRIALGLTFCMWIFWAFATRDE
jgi:uncharacterized membrane protein